MPIYEYICEKCDKKFETLVFGNESPCCPDCGREDPRRLMSACGFVSKKTGGETISSSASGSSCSSCSSSSCSSCGA